MTTSRIMKAMKKIRYAILALAALLTVSCVNKEFDEITDLNLNRCLSPMDLNARVSATLATWSPSPGPWARTRMPTSSPSIPMRP